MSKKTILKKACGGRGGPLVKGAQGIERGLGNIASSAVKGYKSGGLYGGLVGAGKGMEKNIRSNMIGVGNAVKSLVSPKTPVFKDVAGSTARFSRPTPPPKAMTPQTSNRPQESFKAKEKQQMAPGSREIPNQKPFKTTLPRLNPKQEVMKKIIKDRSQGGFQPSKPIIKRA